MMVRGQLLLLMIVGRELQVVLLQLLVLMFVGPLHVLVLIGGRLLLRVLVGSN
jgi:hypothetical protein